MLTDFKNSFKRDSAVNL